MTETTKRKVAEDYIKRHHDIAVEIFKCIEKEYVRLDVDAALDSGVYEEYLDFDENGELMEESKILIDNVCENVAERYAFERDYDCNMSYNDNIESFIEAELCSA